MARKINCSVPLKEIHLNEEVYPRVGYNWQTGYDYSQSMKTGAKFPPITLAVYNGKKIIVDGKHRYEAHKICKKKVIKAEVYVGWTLKKIFEEAIKRNIAHGRVLSPYEKRSIALKLRAMKFKDNEISQLIQVPGDKLQSFVGQRLINTMNGEVIVKSEIKHLAGRNFNEEDFATISGNQASMYANSQVDLLDEIINLLQGGLLDKEDSEIQSRLKKLKTLL